MGGYSIPTIFYILYLICRAYDNSTIGNEDVGLALSHTLSQTSPHRNRID